MKSPTRPPKHRKANPVTEKPDRPQRASPAKRTPGKEKILHRPGPAIFSERPRRPSRAGKVEQERDTDGTVAPRGPKPPRIRPGEPAKRPVKARYEIPAGERVGAAIALLDLIEQTGEPADRVWHVWFRDHRRFDAPDRTRIVELVEDIFRHRALLDWWIARVIRRPASNRLRTFAYLLLVKQRKLPDLVSMATGRDLAPASLNEAERGWMKTLGSHTLQHPDMPVAVALNLPGWIAPLLEEQFGPALTVEMRAMLQPAPLDLRTNVLKTTREAAQAALAAESLQAKPMPFSPVGLRLPPRAFVGNTEALAAGLIEVQDEGSQLAALLVDPAGCKFVVDFCAGAGGKTLAIAGVMQNKNRLIACDVSQTRLNRAKLRLRRAAAHNVECRAIDNKWIKRHAGEADRVLVDAPCTGTGVWRRKPDARWRLQPSDLAELVQSQAKILDSAARLVRPGGRLIYVTCSLLRAENDEQIAAFTVRHPEFAILPVGPVWAATIGGAPPVTGEVLRLTPARHGTDGFFVAVLERKL